MIINIDNINLALFITLVINTSYGFIVYFRNRKILVNKIFFLLALSVNAWIISMIFYRGVSDISTALIACRFLYLSAAITPPILLFFVMTFTRQNNTITKSEKIFLIIPTIVISTISVIPGLLIIDVFNGQTGERITIYNRFLHTIYAMHISSYFIAIFIQLYKNYTEAVGIRKKQVGFIFIGVLIAAFLGLVCNLFLPYFGVFNLNWLGQVGVLGMVVSISYSIIRHRLFDVKVLITEILVYILWLVLFITSYMSIGNSNFLIDVSILILAILIGIFLIKSVRKEVETREHIELLNSELQGIDELKSELVSLATHHISNPLTAIVGYVSLLQEKDLNDEIKKKNILDSLQRLTHNVVTIVRDFLDVSRIENKEIKYNFTNVDIGQILKNIADKYERIFSNRNIEFEYADTTNSKCVIKGDADKLELALSNIFENSLRYADHGRVRVSLNCEGESIFIAIEDEGKRDFPMISKKLSQKLTNLGNGDDVSMISNGLGLYVSNRIIKAHGGKFEIIPNNHQITFKIRI